MGSQGLQLKGLRSYMWWAVTFKLFCKSRKINVCAKCTLEKTSTWVHADTCNPQSSVLYTRWLVGAWIGWFCAGTSGMTIRRLGVYITVCAYQNKSLRLPKHIWFWCIGFTNFWYVCQPFHFCHNFKQNSAAFAEDRQNPEKTCAVSLLINYPGKV